VLEITNALRPLVTKLVVLPRSPRGSSDGANGWKIREEYRPSRILYVFTGDLGARPESTIRLHRRLCVIVDV